MQWLKLAISNLVHSLGFSIRPIINSQNDKSRSGHGSLQNLAFSLNIFAMAEMQLLFLINDKYTEKLQILM